MKSIKVIYFATNTKDHVTTSNIADEIDSVILENVLETMGASSVKEAIDLYNEEATTSRNVDVFEITIRKVR
jgi:hypothetical protein